MAKKPNAPVESPAVQDEIVEVASAINLYPVINTVPKDNDINLQNQSVVFNDATLDKPENNDAYVANLKAMYKGHKTPQTPGTFHANPSVDRTEKRQAATTNPVASPDASVPNSVPGALDPLLQR